jgi:hypothetical protein
VGIFLLTSVSRPAMGLPIPLSNEYRCSFPEVRRPGREAGHAPQPIVELRMRGAIPPLPQYAFMAWCLIKQWIHLQVVVLG